MYRLHKTILSEFYFSCLDKVFQLSPKPKIIYILNKY